MHRRNFFGSTAAVAATALAGCSTMAAPPTAARTPFAVPATYIPVAGSDEMFPVRRIYCIGRNYAAHAIERGSDPTREPPFFFQKPTDAVQIVPLGTPADHPYPVNGQLKQNASPGDVIEMHIDRLPNLSVKIV